MFCLVAVLYLTFSEASRARSFRRWFKIQVSLREPAAPKTPEEMHEHDSQR